MKMRFKGSQSHVFPGTQRLDFLAKNCKAYLSTYLQNKILKVATSVHTIVLHSMPRSYLGHWDIEGRGKAQGALVPRREGSEPGVSQHLPTNLPPLSMYRRDHSVLEPSLPEPQLFGIEKTSGATYPFSQGGRVRGLFVPQPIP